MVVGAGVTYVVVVRAGVSTMHPAKPNKPIHRTYRMEWLLIPMRRSTRCRIMSKGCLPEPRCGESHNDCVMRLRCVPATRVTGGPMCGRAARLMAVVVDQSLCPSQAALSPAVVSVTTSSSLILNVLLAYGTGSNAP